MTVVLVFLSNLAFAGFLWYGIWQYNAHLDIRTMQGMALIAALWGGASLLIGWFFDDGTGFLRGLGRWLIVLSCVVASAHAIAFFLWLGMQYDRLAQ